MSKFIIINEITDTKASLLSFVEFLEAIARCAEKLSIIFESEHIKNLNKFEQVIIFDLIINFDKYCYF